MSGTLKNLIPAVTITFLFLTFAIKAEAGYMEVGGSANYRQTYLDATNYTISTSYTADIAYYFLEFSALEISYTSGTALSQTTYYTANVNFALTGLDVIFSFGGREAALRPYLKVGVASQTKQTSYQQPNFDTIIETVSGYSPSAGAGIKIGITQTMGIRLGVEAWSSPIWNKQSSASASGSTVVSIDNTVTYDVAVRAGISWIF